VNIDADLVVDVEDDVMSLANGCVCCSIRDDLIETVELVLARPEKPEYILLEASGVSDPSSIAMTFTDMKFRDLVRLDSITCLVDADQIFAAPEQMELKLRQMAFSDMIVLNKVDLVDRETIDRVNSWLSSRFRRYRLVEAVNADVPLDILLSVGRFAGEQLDVDVSDHNEHGPDCGCFTDGHSHTAEFATTFVETAKPVQVSRLRLAVKKLPGSVYRIKGFLYTEEEPDYRIVLQVVGKRVDVARERQWGDETPRSRVVAIGAPGSITEDELAHVLSF
jgi:G3E family GTPase